ncbi:DUF885 domain-containing protein [soil metagenome]
MPADQAASSGAGTADEVLDELVRQRFQQVMQRFPVFATYMGLHEHDHRLADGTRDAIEQDIADSRHFLTQLESIDPALLSVANRVERDLAMHATRRQVFDDDVHRVWERRGLASDELGDGIFLLFARESRPLAERLPAISSRLEAASRLMDEHRTRMGERPMRLWNEMELQAVGSLPSLFGDIEAAAEVQLGADHSEVSRLRGASASARHVLEEYAGWLRGQLSRADDDFALGGERYEELIELRALDGLSGDEILDIGRQQLEENRRARQQVAQDIDATATEAEVLDRIKSDHPANFEGALDGYRRAMAEARQFVLDHDIATMPQKEELLVIPTPEYLRNTMPFAAYFSPARFEPQQQGIYIVTPSVDGDAGALREHNYASMYNTSIHEAYPGHHQQLTAANANPSLTRPLVDAPEFVEGWAMYCEQMMREQGFDDSPEHRLMMYTDAIWRACRIILDVQLHRGDIGVADAVDFLVKETGFERPNAAAEVNRYTYTPTYQFSYLLGKVLLLRLREDERARLGEAFSLGRFHDALMAAGSIPISFHRRLLAAARADARPGGAAQRCS